MADAIVVINACSSSIKFSLFFAPGADMELDVRGQMEGIYNAPHFVPKNRKGCFANASGRRRAARPRKP